MATEHEQAVILRCGDGDVLGASWGLLFAVGSFLFPARFLGVELHRVDVVGRHDLLILCVGIFDTTDHQVAHLAAHVGEGVA